MQYADVIEVFFDPSTGGRPDPDPVASAAPARRLRDAFEPLSMHAVWSPLVHERLEARGLDFFGAYVIGRAGVLGTPNAAVVGSTFGAFEPGMIGGVWDQARQIIDVEEGRALTFDAVAESLRGVLDGVDESEIGAVADRLASVVDGLSAAGRPLFGGVQSIAWPDDACGRLWQACLALREHRGDSHIASYITDGFDAVRMNILTELWLGYPVGEYSGTRAWSEEATGEALASLRADGLVDGDTITDRGIEVRDAIEARTDAMEQPVVDALGSDLDSTIDELTGWSASCIEAKTFPPDPRKRAAG